MPKISVHGGPTVAPPKSFGAMLAAARRGDDLTEPAAGPAEAPVDDAAPDATPYIVPDEPEVAEVKPKKAAPRKVQGKGSAVVGDISGSS